MSHLGLPVDRFAVEAMRVAAYIYSRVTPERSQLDGGSPDVGDERERECFSAESCSRSLIQGVGTQAVLYVGCDLV